MRNRNILISGASVAGPVLAYWLRQHGFHPTVVERAPAPRTGGQAIDLRGAAREVATRMGILDAVRARHTGVRGVSYLNNSGQSALHWPADALGDSGGVIAEIEVLRGDLVEILHTAARDTVEYLFDDAIVDLTQTEDGVTVTFERSEARSFDLVVGADGLHSNVRRMAFPAKMTTLSDLGYYLSVFRADAPIELDGWHHMYNTPGTMAGLYPVGHDGTAQHMLYFTSPRLRYDRWDVAEQKSIVRHAFVGQGWQVPRMLERMDGAEDFYFSPARRVEMTHWSHGRAVVVGDAAFAGALGLGTSMAMVGGYVLAGELAAADGDHHRAFARYQDEMRDYVRRNQKLPPGGVRGFIPETRQGIWLRNQLVRSMLALPGKGLLTGRLQDSSNALTLREYRR